MRTENAAPLRKRRPWHARCHTVTVAAVLAASLAASPEGAAIGTDGTSRDLVFPVAVSTTSFSSRLHLLNVDDTTAQATITYHGAPGTVSSGERLCYTRSIPPHATADFDLNELCGLGPGSHYGLVRVNATAFLTGYSRVSNPQGNGFSVDAYPAGQFHGSDLNVLGLKKSAVAPGYSTNCFVASLDEPASYAIRLYDPAGAPLGAPVTGSLAANQLARILDIFAAAGVPGTEHADVRAEVRATQGATPALLGFCTVQNNTNFDADFRLGKSRASAGADAVKSFSGLAPSEPLDGPVAHRFATLVSAPDVIDCSIAGPSAGLLEMRLTGPDGKTKAGGPLAGAFTATTGARGTLTGGEDGVWTIEVRARSAGGPYPLAYTLGCRSGHGMMQPVQLANGSRGWWTEPAETEGTLAAGVRLLDSAELAGIVSEADTQVVLASTSPLQPGDVFVTPSRAYKVVSRTDAGGLATLVVSSPALEEVFGQLRIRASSAAAPAVLASQHQADSVTVKIGDDFITTTFTLTDAGVSGSGGFTARVVRTLLESDLDFADLFDPDTRKSVVLEVDLALDANLSLAYSGGEDPLERKIGTVRIPVRTSVIDAVTGLVLGRTAVSLVIPFSVVLDANVSANATGAATLKSRFTYSPAAGGTSSIASTGGFSFGPPAGGAAATPGARIAAFLMVRARPALGFLDPVALLGLDLQAGAELEGKVDATADSPYYCARFKPYLRATANGFFSTVGLAAPLTTPKLIYRYSLAEFRDPPLQLGDCTPPPLPPSLKGIACSLETDARGHWRWALGGALQVGPPITTGDRIDFLVGGYAPYPGYGAAGFSPYWWEVSRDCGSLAPDPYGGGCIAVVGSAQPVTMNVKMATSAIWQCGISFRGTFGCWGPVNMEYGSGFAPSLWTTDADVVRILGVKALRRNASGSVVGEEGQVTCPEPPRLPGPPS